MLCIDLGCGTVKQAGFVGLDRSPMPGVDLVVDLNGTLPLESDSVDLVYASHSLEHVADLMHTMREIYRVCKHGAQVCILAPYFEQKLNSANSYHLQAFNEHTPRFWSSSRIANVPREEYWHPHATDWGLAESDHSEPGIEFRLARMEMFYFPAFLNASDDERRFARQSLLDVCDQVMYHLIVWKKSDSAEQEIQDAIGAMNLFIPDQVVIRREHDAQRRAQAAADGPPALDWPSMFRNGSVIARQKEEIAALQIHAVRRDYTIDELRARIDQLAERSLANEQATRLYFADATANAHEVATQRSRRLTRAANWLAGNDDVSAALPEQLARMAAGMGGASRVVIGRSLSDVPFAAYRVVVPTTAPRYFDIAIHSPVRLPGMNLGLEIASLRGDIVSHRNIEFDTEERFALYRFPVDMPAEFAGQTVEIRVFSRKPQAPVYTLELRSRWARPRNGQLLGGWST
ncbi:SAM-dependent methyltransferase [Paraburkholderia sp. GAS199]|uniref:class I SAM-dependent methyltransferase n=1 Tax=Paraburkholderia sp. GAS199 TaxID=3035126 RepID=UPI003D1A5457